MMGTIGLPQASAGTCSNSTVTSEKIELWRFDGRRFFGELEVVVEPLLSVVPPDVSVLVGAVDDEVTAIIGCVPAS